MLQVAAWPRARCCPCTCSLSQPACNTMMTCQSFTAVESCLWHYAAYCSTPVWFRCASRALAHALYVNLQVRTNSVVTCRVRLRQACALGSVLQIVALLHGPAMPADVLVHVRTNPMNARQGLLAATSCPWHYPADCSTAASLHRAS